MALTPFNLFLLFSLLQLPLIISISTSSTPSTTSICNSTPHPSQCLEASKLTLSITLPSALLTTLLHSLDAAIADAAHLSSLLSSTRLVERQRGALQDCRDLQQITLSSLQKSTSLVKSSDPKRLSVARTFLSAALTNRATCLEGLDSASGPLKPALVASILNAYKNVANSLSLLPGPTKAQPDPKPKSPPAPYPAWLSERARRVLEIDIGSGPGMGLSPAPSPGPSEEAGDMYDYVVVAKDGSGNFKTVGEAVSWAPSNSERQTIIYVGEGVYEENVEITKDKKNIVLVGRGGDNTFIMGNRSVVDGWTTFRSATLAVAGDGFIARDITIENWAGAIKHQAVALRINADLTAVYRCSIVGYQDSLYAHSFRQFYRECNIYGTVDYIFGNAIVVFQASNIISRRPLDNQFTVVTAQSRDSVDENTGFVLQNCSIIASEDLKKGGNATKTKSYLGRPWREYARTVVMDSYIDDFVDPTGWTPWAGDKGLATLYYGEYANYGPGSGTKNRVKWPGYHVMVVEDASNFTVSEFIMGDEWLDSSVPYYDGV